MTVVELNATTERREIVTNFQMLRDKISESGMTMVAISQKTGILRETLYNCLNGKGEFNASEMVALSRVLNLSNSERDAIFFACEVE
jgi:DNA-binding phage protein